MDRPTTLAHHPSCSAEQAWDIPEAQGYCKCPAFWPHTVCTECWLPPKQHRKTCSRFKTPEGTLRRRRRGI